jgi:hypothetical protein
MAFVLKKDFNRQEPAATNVSSVFLTVGSGKRTLSTIGVASMVPSFLSNARGWTVLWRMLVSSTKSFADVLFPIMNGASPVKAKRKPSAALSVEPYRKERVVAFVAAGHPLAKSSN